MSEKTPEQWGADYRGARGDFESLCAEVRRLVEQLMADAQIDVAQVESRTKSIDSFVDKIHRKSGKYADPLVDMTDLAAMRVIAYFPADVVRIGELIEQQFDIDWSNSNRQSGTTEPDRFGYRSDHYVVRMSPRRLDLPEYRRFDGRRMEIQVRTVMQHAWAAVDHQLRYKNAAQLPVEVSRRLSRLAALLEVADEQFAAIRQEAETLEASYAAEIEQGDFSARLDLLSLEAFLRQTAPHRAWVEVATQVGYQQYPFDDLGPLEHLVDVLQSVGIRDLSGLQEYLAEAQRWGPAYLTALLRQAKGVPITAVPADVLSFLVLRAAPDDDAIIATPYFDGIKRALIALRTGTRDRRQQDPQHESAG